MTARTCLRRATALIAAATLIAACGSGDDSDDGGDDEAATTDVPASDDTTNDTTDDDTTADGGDAGGDEETDDGGDVGGPDDYTPGDISFRVVNTLDEPVDVYVRTTGLVEAFEIETGVAPGDVTDFVAPPADGNFVITTAGGGDPTCVSGCDHVITNLSTFPEEGPFRTVLLCTDPDSGDASTYDLWELPDESRAGNANAMAPADPASGVVVVTAAGVSDADFGLRMAVDGSGVCLEPFNLEGILIGGNQTPAFTYDGDSVDVTIHANDDRECVEAPVGGPFTVDGGPGERSHLFLTGSPGDLDALVVPMVDESGTVAGGGASGGGFGADGESASSGDRDLAISLMTEAISQNLPLDDEQASCTAELIVDAVGVETLIVDGELVDLDTDLSPADDAAAEGAIIDAIGLCDIDPDQLGG